MSLEQGRLYVRNRDGTPFFDTASWKIELLGVPIPERLMTPCPRYEVGHLRSRIECEAYGWQLPSRIPDNVEFSVDTPNGLVSGQAVITKWEGIAPRPPWRPNRPDQEDPLTIIIERYRLTLEAVFEPKKPQKGE